MRAAIIVALVACTPAQRVHVNRAAIVASTAGLACDWGQTRSVAAAGWGIQHEANPIMGRQPSPLVVDAYFATTAVINVAAWILMPERWRAALPSIVIAAQGKVIAHNVNRGIAVCGL